MNPSNKEAASLVPTPGVAEQVLSTTGANEGAPAGIESPISSPENTANLSTSAMATATIPLPLPQTTVPPVSPTSPSGVATAMQSATPQVDDDGDLIEKEWVNKAKQIVERNRDDPYKQSEELTVFRADYMKKRYGKTIKLSQ